MQIDQHAQINCSNLVTSQCNRANNGSDIKVEKFVNGMKEREKEKRAHVAKHYNLLMSNEGESSSFFYHH